MKNYFPNIGTLLLLHIPFVDNSDTIFEKEFSVKDNCIDNKYLSPHIFQLLATKLCFSYLFFLSNSHFLYPGS